MLMLDDEGLVLLFDHLCAGYMYPGVERRLRLPVPGHGEWTFRSIDWTPGSGYRGTVTGTDGTLIGHVVLDGWIEHRADGLGVARLPDFRFHFDWDDQVYQLEENGTLSDLGFRLVPRLDLAWSIWGYWLSLSDVVQPQPDPEEIQEVCDD